MPPPPGYTSFFEAMERIRSVKGGKPQTIEDLIKTGVVIIGSPNTVREKLAETSPGHVAETQFGTLPDDMARAETPLLRRKFCARFAIACRKGGSAPLPNDKAQGHEADWVAPRWVCGRRPVGATAAHAQDYPIREFCTICPFAPGADIVVRYYASKLAEIAGKPVITENCAQGWLWNAGQSPTATRFPSIR